MKKRSMLLNLSKAFNKRMLSDWFSAALQTSRKCGLYDYGRN